MVDLTEEEEEVEEVVEDMEEEVVEDMEEEEVEEEEEVLDEVVAEVVSTGSKTSALLNMLFVRSSNHKDAYYGTIGTYDVMLC